MVCNFRTMRFLLYPVLALAIVACAPQAAFFHVEARDMTGYSLNMEGKQVAVFSLASANTLDSVRTVNAALGFSEKLREDRGFEDPLPLFYVSSLEFSGFNDGVDYDRLYLKDLMLSTGADLQIFLHSLKYQGANVIASTGFDSGYNENVLSIPYSAGLHIYDAMEDSLVFGTNVRDTVYMSVLAKPGNQEYNAVIAGVLQDVSKVVGEVMASKVSMQWNLQERLLVNYPDNPDWEKPLAKAMDFKWEEAIDLWMPFTESRNFRIAAFAAYNVAVGCEMLERMDLAKEWAEFSVKRFSFKENEELRAYLKKK